MIKMLSFGLLQCLEFHIIIRYIPSSKLIVISSNTHLKLENKQWEQFQ